MKIIIDDKIPFINGVLEPFADVVYMAGNEMDKDACADSDALIIRTRTKCNESLLSGTNVKFIATATIGFDHIDREYCRAAGIKWVNAPGCNSGSVKQWFLSALSVYLHKNNLSYSECTIGVVGVGNVGSKIVEVAENLGCKVLLNDPPRGRKEGRCGFVSLETIQRECNIITFHVPLNLEGEDKTYHLVDEEFILKLNSGTLLINSCRGEVFDTSAVKSYLKSGDLRDVIIDVWESEPNLDIDLLNSSFIATPHIAGYSVDGKSNGTTMAVNAISKFFGLPLNDWTPDDEILNEEKKLIVDAYGKTFQQIVQEVCLNSYDIISDDRSLRNMPERFEKLRGNYPIRKEPHNWEVQLQNCEYNYSDKLQKLGFMVKSPEI